MARKTIVTIRMNTAEIEQLTAVTRHFERSRADCIRLLVKGAASQLDAEKPKKGGRHGD